MKNRDILLPTFSDAPDYNADFDYFKVLITPDFAKKVLRRIEMLKAIRNVDSMCFEISFWDSHGDYYSGGHEEGHDPAKLPLSSECEKMVVMDSGVYWSCIPKHTEITISTEHFNVMQLETLAKED